jgi:hypothetical protein
MAKSVKNLRRPITAQIEGKDCTLLTIGYMAAAIHRTSWTIKYWERLGLLPPAPFVVNPERLRTKRHLYPEQFVAAIARVMNDYPGERLERDQWRSFRKRANEAYAETIGPLLTPGVITPVPVIATPR